MDISRLIVQSLVAWWGRGAWSSRSKEEAAGGGWCAGRKEVDFICKRQRRKRYFSFYVFRSWYLSHTWSLGQQKPTKIQRPLFSFYSSCNATTLINHGRVHENARRHEHSKCSLHIIFSIQIIRYRFNSIQSWAWLDRTRVINEWIITKNYDNGRSVK